MRAVRAGCCVETVAEGSPRLFRGQRRVDRCKHVRFLVFQLAPSKPKGCRSPHCPVPDFVFAAPDQELDGAEESRNFAILLIADMLRHRCCYGFDRRFALYYGERYAIDEEYEIRTPRLIRILAFDVELRANVELVFSWSRPVDKPNLEGSCGSIHRLLYRRPE